jgi:hypothetical protein
MSQPLFAAHDSLLWRAKETNDSQSAALLVLRESLCAKTEAAEELASRLKAKSNAVALFVAFLRSLFPGEELPTSASELVPRDTLERLSERFWSGKSSLEKAKSTLEENNRFLELAKNTLSDELSQTKDRLSLSRDKVEQLWTALASSNLEIESLKQKQEENSDLISKLNGNLLSKTEEATPVLDSVRSLFPSQPLAEANLADQTHLRGLFKQIQPSNSLLIENRRLELDMADLRRSIRLLYSHLSQISSGWSSPLHECAPKCDNICDEGYNDTLNSVVTLCKRDPSLLTKHSSRIHPLFVDFLHFMANAKLTKQTSLNSFFVRAATQTQRQQLNSGKLL